MTVYSPNRVPILYVPGEKLTLTQEVWERLEREHADAQLALEQAAKDVHAASGDVESDEYADARDAQAAVIAEHLLIGHSVVLDNPDETQADFTFSGIGASDIKEAATEVIGGFDRGHVGEVGQEGFDHILTPKWVASTHEFLAEVLANYYGCEVRPMNEVLV